LALTNFPLYTWYEAADRVLDGVVGGGASARNLRQARQAVDEAYEILHLRRNWRYYYRPFRINTVASQTTGSIAYDYTGGSSERLVTLTGATWPTDAEKYTLLIAGVRYEIDRYLSSTTIMLSERVCPQSDIASGTAYTLVRDTYELPDDFAKLGDLRDVLSPGRPIPRVAPSDILREQRLVRTAAVPSMYSIFRTTRFASGLAVVFGPAPSSARQYDGMGLIRPQPLKVFDYSAIGTVATTADSTTLTGTGTAFTADHEGAVIRISSDSKLPSALIGEVDKDRYNPYAMQRIIKRRTDATTLVLEQAADQSITTGGYRVSSRIDIEPGVMRVAFLRLAESLFGLHDRKGREEREAIAERAFAIAAAADATRMLDDAGGTFQPETLADLAASVDLGS
jgi:hypothetical protein